MATNRISKYVSDSWKELKNVTWPTKAELRKHTILVVILSLLVAVFLGVCDYLISSGIENFFIR
ncbi:MAG: preprotein translocase subunit SecE [Candidatus Buchananbacteria bacterium]|jgi:preprotein translocase subunit SecE